MSYQCARQRITQIAQARAWAAAYALCRDIGTVIAMPAVHQDADLVDRLIEARARVSAVAAVLERRAEP